MDGQTNRQTDGRGATCNAARMEGRIINKSQTTLFSVMHHFVSAIRFLGQSSGL